MTKSPGVDQSLNDASVLFDGRRLTQARHLRGLLKADVAASVDLTPAAIGQFERGVVHPRPLTVARLGLALAVPPDFFVERPQFSIPEGEAHFRSLRSTAKRERDAARARVEILAELIHWLEQRLHLPDVDLPVTELHHGPAAAAATLRAAWKLGSGPVSNMVGLLERRGFVVARLRAGTDDVDAFSCWLAGRPYILLTSNKTAAERSRFDAAHELGHFVLHHDAKPGDPIVESEAHQFAAEFLMPKTVVSSELPSRLDWGRYLALKKRWGTSIAALVRRGRDLDVITEHAFRRAMMELSRRGWRTHEPHVGRDPELPELVRLAFEILRADRGIGISEVAREIHISANDALTLASMTAATDDRKRVLMPD
jgi:Zn-dependent peptidase ImmA (M78 family)/transcriptional regulator with XRE-family HTH domain